MRGLICLGLGIFLLVACQTTVKHEATPSDYIVRNGEVFKIELKSNPTTGYHWVMENSAEVNLVDSLSDIYTQDEKSNENVVGSGGTQTFQFKATRKGIDTLSFIYVRPWEVGAVPADKASFIVEVR